MSSSDLVAVFRPDPGPLEPVFAADAADGSARSLRPPDLEERLRNAFEEGRAAARAELPVAEAESLRSTSDALAEALRAASTLRRDYLRDQRELLVELALDIAGWMLGREVESAADQLAPAVERALQSLASEAPPVLRLPPGQVEAVASGMAPELARLVAESELELVADAALQPGDFRLLADGRQVDARLDAIRVRLREELGLAFDAAEDPE